MNAAARVLNQSSVFAGHWTDIRFSKTQCILIMFLLAFLCSAMAVVYVTNELRLSLNELERLEMQAHQQRLEHGQLMLEQAALSAPSRIRSLATQKLNMHLLPEQDIKVIHIAA